MKYLIDKKENYTSISLQEENLNSIIAPDLKSEFIMMHTEGVSNLILDLTDVKFVDSSGLSAILTAHRIWRDGLFILTGVQHASVKQLITISRLENVFTIIPTIAEAADFVAMSALEQELLSNVEETEEVNEDDTNE